MTGMAEQVALFGGMMVALLVVLGALLITVIVAPIWMLWRYLSWVRSRRQYYLEHGNRKRKR